MWSPASCSFSRRRLDMSPARRSTSTVAPSPPGERLPAFVGAQRNRVCGYWGPVVLEQLVAGDLRRRSRPRLGLGRYRCYHTSEVPSSAFGRLSSMTAERCVHWGGVRRAWRRACRELGDGVGSSHPRAKRDVTQGQPGPLVGLPTRRHAKQGKILSNSQAGSQPIVRRGHSSASPPGSLSNHPSAKWRRPAEADMSSG